MRTGRGQEEEGLDVSPSSSRSLPVTTSFAKMVSVVPTSPSPAHIPPKTLAPLLSPPSWAWAASLVFWAAAQVILMFI